MCMSNVRSIITSHNTRIIRKSQPGNNNCNCRNKHTCSWQNKCISKDIVYKATINTDNTWDTKYYIGMTSSTFKERYRNHVKSFTPTKTFKRNGTFDARLALAKKNRFHHKVLNNKKVYFFRIENMQTRTQIVFGGKKKKTIACLIKDRK